MNILDILRLDTADMNHEQQEIVALLRRIGLSDYEAKAYLALVMKSSGTAEDIADLASIPRTSSYKVLESLKQKGFVSLKGGRPTVFYPVNSQEVKERLMGELEKVFYKLEMLTGLLSERGTPQLVYTISGKERVIAKIGEMLDAAKEKFLISSPAIREINHVHATKFRDAVKRGVEVIVVAEPLSKVPEHTKVLRRSDLIATDVITDSELAMIASPDLSLCGYTDNPFLAAHLENFINVAIGKTEDAD